MAGNLKANDNPVLRLETVCIYYFFAANRGNHRAGRQTSGVSALSLPPAIARIWGELISSLVCKMGSIIPVSELL